MAKVIPATIGEALYWAYANLGMAHAAISSGCTQYARVHYMIRAKLYSRLRTGAMDLGPLSDDERVKLDGPKLCCYCGSGITLSLDHLLPKSLGGPGSGDNLVWCCRSCNSSKGACDLLAWHKRRGKFPPLLVLRRYLKLAIIQCRALDLMDCSLRQAPDNLPFSLEYLPTAYPPLSDLCLRRVRRC